MIFTYTGKLAMEKGGLPVEKWFWIFVCYSFLGYLLERIYAKATMANKQVRKCFFLLPLCPVYGLAMGAHLALLPGLEEVTPLRLILQGALVATAVEYLVHLFYDRVLGVRFWDYTGIRGNLRGRICPSFSTAWGGLSALAVVLIQPILNPLLSLIPNWLTYGALLLVTADAVLSTQLLRRYSDTEILSWRAVARRLAE